MPWVAIIHLNFSIDTYAHQFIWQDNFFLCIHKSWHKMQTFPLPVFLQFVKKLIHIFCHILWIQLRFRHVHHLKMAVWTLVFGKKWSEMVKKRQLGQPFGVGYCRPWSLQLYQMDTILHNMIIDYFSKKIIKPFLCTLQTLFHHGISGCYQFKALIDLLRQEFNNQLTQIRVHFQIVFCEYHITN